MSSTNEQLELDFTPWYLHPVVNAFQLEVYHVCCLQAEQGRNPVCIYHNIEGLPHHCMLHVINCMVPVWHESKIEPEGWLRPGVAEIRSQYNTRAMIMLDMELLSITL